LPIFVDLIHREISGDPGKEVDVGFPDGLGEGDGVPELDVEVLHGDCAPITSHRRAPRRRGRAPQSRRRRNQARRGLPWSARRAVVAGGGGAPPPPPCAPGGLPGGAARPPRPPPPPPPAPARACASAAPTP